MKWRTAHKRKRKATRVWSDAELLALITPAFEAFFQALTTHATDELVQTFRQMAQALAGLSQALQPRLPRETELDADPFWEEWPEIIDG